MDAVIDPVEVKVVGFVPPNAQLTGPWADFIMLPAPEDMDQDTLGVTKDGDEYVFIVDPAKVAQKTADQWTSVRAQQRQKLYESDWTCSVTDYEVPNKPEWVTYRQALRDVTRGSAPSGTEGSLEQTDPFNITWPAVPQ
jgi:hypothetical protein